MTTMKTPAFTVLAASLLTSTSLRAQQLFSDRFDSDTSANYTTITSSADTDLEFAYDYSELGIPTAPNTPDGTTLGLRMAANIADPGAPEAITLATVQQFTGDFSVSFDMWINANGPFPLGGAGSTEFVTAGVGGDGLTANLGGNTGIGGWIAVNGEGGSTRDYRLYKFENEQFPASGQYVSGNNHNDPLFAGFGGIDVGSLPVQGLLPQHQFAGAYGWCAFCQCACCQQCVACGYDMARRR